MAADRPQSRLAVITGGGSGIGLELARAFAGAGYHVIICGRDLSRLKTAAAALQADATSITPLFCDVRDPAAVAGLFAELRRQYPAVDVLINNAGISHQLAPAGQLPFALWKDVLDTNLTGTFLVTQAALPLMSAGATVVNNLSVAALHPFPGLAAYNAAKSGALGFTNTLREELREKGIRVLALLPGATDTDIWNGFWPDAPRHKMASAQTVAAAVLHAVSAPAGTAIEEIRIGPTAGVL